MSQLRPYRKFRPLQESINIVEKMLAIEAYYGDEDAIEYWTKRLHGYLKLAALNKVKVTSSLHDERDKEQ